MYSNKGMETICFYWSDFLSEETYYNTWVRRDRKLGKILTLCVGYERVTTQGAVTGEIQKPCLVTARSHSRALSGEEKIIRYKNKRQWTD